MRRYYQHRDKTFLMTNNFEQQYYCIVNESSGEIMFIDDGYTAPEHLERGGYKEIEKERFIGAYEKAKSIMNRKVLGLIQKMT